MSWSPLLPDRAGKIYNQRPAISASTTAGGGNMRPRLTLMIRAAQLEGVTWLTPGSLVQALVGHGEHAGMVRVLPKGQHLVGKVALAKPADGLVSMRLPLPPGIAPGARPSVAVEYEFQEGWVEITLPQWGAPPAAAKAAEPRGIALAREAAAEAKRRAGL